MKKIVECIPNFSEGTNKKTINAILHEIQQVKDVHILDHTFDSDYNRLVVTFFGSPEPVKEAALAATAKAIELIDMRNHTGQHPRIGAVDVVPFVPLKNVSIDECIKLSKDFAAEASKRHQVPVYLYDSAATNPDRRDIDWIRRGEWEGLAEAIKDPQRKPDYGPSKPHPTAGAMITGAREIMAGLNINLGTADLKIAKKIAKAIHGKKGGLTYVKAMGTLLKDRNITQIGISNTNPRKTPLYRQFELVKIEAAKYGVSVIGAEICGLIPLQSIIDTFAYYLRLDKLSEDQILETAIQKKLEEAIDQKMRS